jgi:hypothetical protein
MVNDSKIMLGSAYRSPSNSVMENDELISSLNTAANESDKYDACILTGDFNLRVDWNSDVPRPRDSLGNEFLNTFYNFVPHQLVDTPTRVVGDDASLIDLLLCDNTNLITECNVIPGVSYHYAICATLNFKSNAPPPTKRVIYDYKRANWDKLKNVLEARLPVGMECDINVMWEEWKSGFLALCRYLHT